MKLRLRDYRIHALALAIAAIGVGCATDAPLARAKPDAQQTVAMVRAGQFAALNRYYAAVQASYDKGSMSDETLRSVFRNFHDTSPDLAARYQLWVKEMPDSYVAHVARAIYYVKVGQASRGNRIIADTSEAQLRGMDAAFSVAFTELQKSYHLDAKPLLTVFYLVDIGMYDGAATQNRQLLQYSLEIDPKNFIVREMYIQTLMTAWGGSTEKIKAFVVKSRTAGLSATQMKDLESFVFADEAWIDDVDNKNYKRAAAEYLEAAKLSGDDTCLLCASRDLVKVQDYPDAAPVLTQYLARHPDSAEALGTRGYVYFKLGRTDDGVRDCKRAAELGDAYCEYAIGTGYAFGGLGLPKDLEKGIGLLRLSAAQGYQPARNLLPIALSERLASSQQTQATRSSGN